jgi:ABC-type branched-subunit amino acid transport system ATPase component
MLAIARGLMARPKLLLLDEPSLGLAPAVIQDLFAALDRLRRESATILLVDQMSALALSLADRAYVLEGGASPRAAAPMKSPGRRTGKGLPGSKLGILIFHDKTR